MREEKEKKMECWKITMETMKFEIRGIAKQVRKSGKYITFYVEGPEEKEKTRGKTKE